MVIFCFTAQAAVAEIVNVVVTYNKDLCDSRCNQLLERTFKKMEQTTEVSASPGQILLKWEPNTKFTYHLVKRPMQMVGLSIDGIFVTVKGTAHVAGQKASITSLGDNTKFDLTSAPAPKGGQYVQYNNPISYELLPDVREQLREAQKKRELVTVSGFLLMPHRMPLTIVVNNVSIEKEKKEKNQLR